MRSAGPLTGHDLAVVEAMENFLSWGLVAARPGDPPRLEPLPLPPAVWAYMRGRTSWCPPPGTW